MIPAYIREMVKTYQSWAQSHCAPIFWQDADHQPHGGTITFLRTDSGVLGVTNAHVADGLVECADKIGRRCQIGGAYLDQESRFISRHPELDLATFQLSEVFMAQVDLLSNYSVREDGKTEPATVPDWPPSPPAEDEAVFFGGYPATYRRALGTGDIEFKFGWVAAKVQSASERNIGMVLDLEKSESLTPLIRIPPNADLGGWSGGPVFRILDRNGIERLELSAIIYEYSAPTEITLAHPLTSLMQDGTFNVR